jgi:hypothetical protein
MNKPRQTILRLVAEGKITVEEADELLDAVDKGSSGVFGEFFDPKIAGERARAAGDRARAAGARAREAGERARERAARAKREAKERARAAKASAKSKKADWKKEYDYEAAFDFNWPWDQPDWQWPWEKPDWQWPWEKAGEDGGKSEFDIPEEAHLRIRNDGGDLVIKGTDEGTMMTITGMSAASKVAADDKEIQVSSAGEDMVIQVPENVASVEIAQTGGDMSITELKVDLVARVTGGDMSVSGAAGKIQAFTEGGDLSLAGISSTEVEARANAGDISLEILKAIEEGSVSLSSDSGDIALKLSPESKCEISANTDNGEIGNSLPPELTEIVDQSDNHLNAKLNGGGAEFVIFTGTGDIAIRASVSPA